MDLNQIYYFVTVIECGSYTKAAQKLSISKSTLSRHILRLEDSVKTRLLHRSTRQIRLTKAGERFFNSCLPLITHLQNAHRQTSQYHKDITGRLRVTMPPEFGTMFLSDLLPRFLEQHPNIQIELDLSTHNQDLISQGFDLAIRIGELEDSSYIAKRIATAKMGLYASPAYLLSQTPPRCITELNQHKNIIISVTKGTLLLKGEAPILIDNYQISSNSMRLNKQLCMDAQGLTVLPDILCEDEVTSGKLVKLLPETPFEHPHIYAVYPSRIHPTKALTTLINFIAHELAKRDTLQFRTK